MAKIAYTKLNAKINTEVATISVEGCDSFIEVRQYLPVDEKLGLIGRVIELAHDNNNFSNPVKLNVYLELEIIYAYTNIAFTEKQKENITKLYDNLTSSGWMGKILNAIPVNELVILQNGLRDTVTAYYNYNNSVLGILDRISADYSGLNFDITELQKNLADGDNIGLIKNIIDKLG